MQEEVNQKVVALSVQTGKTGARITAKALQMAMRKYLAHQSKTKSVKQPAHGKQTIKSLMKQNVQLTNIEITDQNIRSFERVARKYNIDFALKKDKLSDPPKYLVFFKAKDVDVMTAAFQEYASKDSLVKDGHSIMEKLSAFIERANKMARDLVKEKQQVLER